MLRYWLSDGWKKNWVAQQNGVGWGFATGATGFSGKIPFFLSLYFHHDILSVTNFTLVLHVCIINVMIFIKNC